MLYNKNEFQKKFNKLRQKPWRRVLIVLVLVCFGMFLSSSIWINKSIIVSFHAKTSKDLTFQVFYTTQPKTNFSEKESQKKFVKAGNHNVIFELPINNIIRFRIDPGSNSGEVKLSNITVSGNKSVRLDGEDLWRFNNHIENYSYYDGVLSLVSNQRDPHLTYKKELALLAGTYVDWCLFVICLAFAIFIFSVLVFYLAKFKIFELRSRIEIVFLTAFFALLLVPMSHISDAEKSEQENRMLARSPSLYVNGQINKAYGTDFEKWFNDRFWGREYVISQISSLTYNLSNIYTNKKAIYFKKNGWMFNLPLVPLFFDKQKMQEINKTIQTFDTFLSDREIKFYILLVPKKESIYQDLLVDYGYDIKKDKKFHRSIFEIINGNEKKQIIYPYEELMKAKQQDYVFFKQAHHWTDWGAYQGYKKLLNRIKSDFPDINIASLDDYKMSTSTKIRDDWSRNFNNGHTTNLLNLNSRVNDILTTEYKYYDKKNSSIIEKRNNYTKDFFNEAGKYRIFLTGNSQNEDLLQFMAYSAKELKYLRLNAGQVSNNEVFKFMKYYQKELLDFKPDIVILTVSVEIFSKIIDFYKE